MCGFELSMIEISQEQAQRFITDNQLLTKRYKADDVVAVAKRIHNVQIDTISVVARSHDLTIFSRLPESWWKKWVIENQKVVADVYNFVKKNGPTCSSEFKREDKSKVIGWWDWKKEKSALEYLFYIGRLMIAYRKGIQKIL